MQIDSLPEVASMIASLGFAVWFAWHTTTKTLPSLHERHAAEREVLFKAAAEERKESRLEFRASLKDVTDHCKEELQQIVSTLQASIK